MRKCVSQLRVVGCVAYAHVLERMRKKLDDRSEKNIFVGYIEESKSYKLYNSITNKAIISIYVDKSWHEQVEETNQNYPFPHAFILVKNSGEQESTQRLPRL